MLGPIRKKISISNLTANIENPRFELVGSQHEAIDIMVKDQRNKLLKLAEHIVKNGLNPSEMPIIVPHEKEKGYFNVVEGNRRIVALKLLHNPDMVKIYKSFCKKLKTLNHKFRSNPINDVECIVYGKLEDAVPWIELKHTGENEGIGTVRWDTQQTARFNERTSGKSSIALQAIDFLKKASGVPNDIKSNLKKLPSTNLDRLLRDKNVQDLLGISIVEERLQTQVPEKEIIKGLIKVARDLILGNIKVKHIYTKSDRETYLETFKQDEIPRKEKQSASPWELTSYKTTAQAVGLRGRGSAPTERTTLIPRDCNLHITDHRIRDVYRELKGLDCKFVNAIAVLFRVFIELSLDAFMDKHKQKPEFRGVSEDSTLKAKIESTINYFKNNAILNKNELKGIRVVISSKHSIFSLHTFHAYVHNRHFSPIATDLKTVWNNIQLFVQKIWE